MFQVNAGLLHETRPSTTVTVQAPGVEGKTLNLVPVTHFTAWACTKPTMYTLSMLISAEANIIEAGRMEIVYVKTRKYMKRVSNILEI